MTLTIFIQYYFILLLFFLIVYTASIYFLRQGLSKLHCESNTQSLPSISIIVSMHNEASNATPCVEKLVDLDYPKDLFEIILVNDRSTDNTADIIEGFAKRYSFIQTFAVQTVDPDFAPKKHAIDQAIHRAKGEIILLTDADGRVPNGWAKHMVECFSDNVGMVIGYAPYNTSSPFNRLLYRLLSLEYLSHASVAAATTGLRYPVTCVGTNIAYRKKVYIDLNGFGKFRNIHTGDDDLFLQRIREETDWQIKYCTHRNSQVLNDPPTTWKKFFHQRLRYASKGFLYPIRVTFSLIFFYIFNLLLILSPITLLLDSGYAILIIILLTLKGIIEFNFLNTAASSLNDMRHIHLFPVAFLLHIPYVVVFGVLGQLRGFKWGDLSS